MDSVGMVCSSSNGEKMRIFERLRARRDEVSMLARDWATEAAVPEGTDLQNSRSSLDDNAVSCGSCCAADPEGYRYGDVIA